MIDDDLFDFVLAITPYHPLGCAVWLVVVCVPGLIWTLWSANKCSDLCEGEGRMIESHCYCVSPDGALREHKEEVP